MDLQTMLQQLEDLQRKCFAYDSASSALYLDGVTVAPRDTAEGRGIAQGILAGERHTLMTCPETGKLLEGLSQQREELSPLQWRQVEELTRSYRQLTRIPPEEYKAYARLTNDASDLWHKAKEQDDFSLFAPILEKVVATTRTFAGYYNPEKAPYDALLDEYERGMNTTFLDSFFTALREKLVPLIQAVGKKPPIDDSFLYQEYPIPAQRALSDYLMDVLGLDRSHCGIGETEHPFTLNFTNKDVRITTRYDKHNVAFSMYSVIHEGGHAKYELGIGDDLQYTCLAGNTSMGIHESQSRFYENIIGRSRPFVEAVFPKLRKLFPTQLSVVTPEMFYRAVNKVTPSLIRTEADELTYSLHIMIRYELEKALMDGTLAVRDIPAAWNRLYKEYLGIDVPDNQRGCLQDSHWSGGGFGYFPSYALGSAYGAQMLDNMEREIDVWEPVSRGDLGPVSRWLGEKVHRYGGFLTPAAIIQNACGNFDPNVYVRYLTKKYSELYSL